jgi:hypothetical protein
LAGESAEKGIANILLCLNDSHDSHILQVVSCTGVVNYVPGTVNDVPVRSALLGN